MSDTALTFEPTEIPTVHTGAGRPKLPNPFRDAVKSLAEGPRDETGKSVTALTTLVPAEDAKTLVAQAQRAGEEFGVTVRKTLTDEGAPKGQSFLTIWVTPRITRPRKAVQADQD